MSSARTIEHEILFQNAHQEYDVDETGPIKILDYLKPEKFPSATTQQIFPQCMMTHHSELWVLT